MQHVNARLGSGHLVGELCRSRPASCRPPPTLRSGGPAAGSAARSAAGSRARCRSARPRVRAQSCANLCRQNCAAHRAAAISKRTHRDQLSPGVVPRREREPHLVRAGRQRHAQECVITSECVHRFAVHLGVPIRVPVLGHQEIGGAVRAACQCHSNTAWAPIGECRTARATVPASGRPESPPAKRWRCRV